MKINQALLLIALITLSACGEQKVEYSCNDMDKLEELSSDNNQEAQKALVKCYQEKADQGDAWAQTSLGLLYDLGKWVEKDLAKAMELYRKATDQNYAWAQSNLGYLYYYGNGTEKNLEKAKELYQKASDQGYRVAQYYLGDLYYYGQGVEKNLTKAKELYQKSADQGYRSSQYSLGHLYYHGQGVEKDRTKAAEFYQKAADQGYAPSQYSLGLMYTNGEGVEKNLEKAIELYQKAVDQGDASAQNNLGTMYFEGNGVEKNLLKAAELFQKSADQGNENAINNLKNKSLKIATPFNLQVGNITLNEIKTKYTLTKKGMNKWTDQPMYQVEPISQIDFDGLEELTLIFDEKEILQAISANFRKEKFDNLLSILSNKYHKSYQKIPRVGDKKVEFTMANGIMFLESIHLKQYTNLFFNTYQFESLWQNKLKAEKLLKKQKEESML